MFVAHCPRHGSRVLLGYSDVERVENTDDGILVHYQCFCGARWAERTGRRRGTAIA
jgi:hypothetical protein